MNDFAYPAWIVRTRAGVFEVQFLDLKEAFTEGDTFEEATENASEVLSGVMLTRIAHGMEIPNARNTVKGKDIHYILPDAKTQSALVIRAAFKGRNMAQIARELETSWPAVNRLRDPGHWPTLKLLDRALKAVGKELVITIRNRKEAAIPAMGRRIDEVIAKLPKERRRRIVKEADAMAKKMLAHADPLGTERNAARRHRRVRSRSSARGG
jgi:antitoxin HicB